jgi:carboxymethylenebutenolidase
LGAEKADYCAAIDASGGAQSWAQSPELQERMIRAVKNARAPVFFFQAANDYDLAPSQKLAAAMKQTGRIAEVKIYPAYGQSAREGHSFAYLGSSMWADDVFRFLKQHCGN